MIFVALQKPVLQEIRARTLREDCSKEGLQEKVVVLAGRYGRPRSPSAM